MEKLMNEENEWDRRILAGVKEGPADCLRIDEVAAVLKTMKTHKATGLSGLVAEATGDIGTLWILNLCNGIMKKVPSQRTGSQVWYYQFTVGKGIQSSVDLTDISVNAIKSGVSG